MNKNWGLIQSCCTKIESERFSRPKSWSFFVFNLDICGCPAGSCKSQHLLIWSLSDVHTICILRQKEEYIHEMTLLHMIGLLEWLTLVSVHSRSTYSMTFIIDIIYHNHSNYLDISLLKIELLLIVYFLYLICVIIEKKKLKRM